MHIKGERGKTMSSEVDSGGIVAAAVMLPVGVAFGAGWLAWQGGRLLIEANRSADRQIAEKKRQLKEAALHRKRSALAVHSQLVDMCNQLLSKIEGSSITAGIANYAELEHIKVELKSICGESLPDDVLQIESLNSIGFLKLERLAIKQKHLLVLAEEDGIGLYRGTSLADLMEDLRVAIHAMEIQATRGKDIKVADPVVLERVKLNERLSGVTERVMDALTFVTELTSQYGLLTSYKSWFHSCFNGIDEQIMYLYMPSTTNEDLKKGIKRVESILEQFDMIAPTIKSEQINFATLYQVYVDASKALGEPIASVKSFKTLKELEDCLSFLKHRSEQARECAEIYQKLGPTAYICYAWDQELRALGYTVHTRKVIAEMAKYKPQHARLGENKLPFYCWDKEDLTQLYAMTSECSLQVIVHDDGSVTMQTISDADTQQTRAVQTGHCSILGKLHENLRKNWFVMYDYQENASPNEITSVADWFGAEDSAWQPDRDALIIEQRRKEKGERGAAQSQ